jgi:hypothetical protein
MAKLKKQRKSSCYEMNEMQVISRAANGIHFLLAMSQIKIVLSVFPEAAIVPSREIVKPNGFALACHSQEAAVGREGEREDCASPTEIAKLAPSVGIPECQCAVAGATDQDLIIGRIGDRVNLIAMPKTNRSQACRGTGGQRVTK